jgi:hypothetical protein
LGQMILIVGEAVKPQDHFGGGGDAEILALDDVAQSLHLRALRQFRRHESPGLEKGEAGSVPLLLGLADVIEVGGGELFEGDGPLAAVRADEDNRRAGALLEAAVELTACPAGPGPRFGGAEGVDGPDGRSEEDEAGEEGEWATEKHEWV